MVYGQKSLENCNLSYISPKFKWLVPLETSFKRLKLCRRHLTEIPNGFSPDFSLM